MLKRNIMTKVLLVALVLGISLVTFPASVYAQGTREEANPPAGVVDRHARLERIWARELAMYERQEKLLDRADGMIDKVEMIIARAQEKGLDTSALEAALDEFEDALKDAKVIHQSANGIVTSHKGFDENGKVTDPEKALETVKQLGEHLRDFRQTLGQPFRSLIQAIRELLSTNRPPHTDSGIT